MGRVIEQSSDFTGGLAKYPIRPWKMAGVSVWQSLKVVLVLGLCVPEVTGGFNFCNDFTRP